MRLAGNEIYNAPHAGIIHYGNDMLIENNIIHNIATETHDVGAIYSGRDWTLKGNVIRYNHIYDVGVAGKRTCEGIYLDDCLCGQQVYGNIVEGCARGVLLGAGQDNIIEDNVFIGCTSGISVDARGRSWARSFFDGSTTWIYDRLKEFDYKNPPLSVRYPELPELDHRVMDWPSGNKIKNNYFAQCTQPLKFHDGVEASDVELSGNIICY
jgi:parallel beta-helix repeat protein